MTRLYLFVCNALWDTPDGLQLRSRLDWSLAGSGDEISERAWAVTRETFPEQQGYFNHRVMIATVDDATVEMLMAAKMAAA